LKIRSRITIDDLPYELFKALEPTTGCKVSTGDDWVWLTIGDLICFLSKEDSDRYRKDILAGEEE
tara:strand:+ start:909 stop:1103 length:195 start_codon:yes stop_codon:yes gene_type:complete